MTRINLVDPVYLTDQHLIAEYRELPMVLPSLNRTLNSKVGYQITKRPPHATTGTGHVYFFYDKLLYLHNRYLRILKEGARRGFTFHPDERGIQLESFFDFPDFFVKDFTPKSKDIKPIRERIINRVLEKPYWYRYEGKPIDDKFLVRLSKARI